MSNSVFTAQGFGCLQLDDADGLLAGVFNLNEANIESVSNIVIS